MLVNIHSFGCTTRLKQCKNPYHSQMNLRTSLVRMTTEMEDCSVHGTLNPWGTAPSLV